MAGPPQGAVDENLPRAGIQQFEDLIEQDGFVAAGGQLHRPERMQPKWGCKRVSRQARSVRKMFWSLRSGWAATAREREMGCRGIRGGISSPRESQFGRCDVVICAGRPFG